MSEGPITLSETIMLERSGLAMKRMGRLRVFYSIGPFSVESFHANEDWWVAHGTSGRMDAPLASCLSWLDAQALALRATLLPPGSFVVSDGQETRERVARALSGYTYKRHDRLRVADAVLAELKEVKRG